MRTTEPRRRGGGGLDPTAGARMTEQERAVARASTSGRLRSYADGIPGGFFLETVPPVLGESILKCSFLDILFKVGGWQ
ncbi:hypothetical protein GN956_G18820 [Arapaima gigas]